MLLGVLAAFVVLGLGAGLAIAALAKRHAAASAPPPAWPPKYAVPAGWAVKKSTAPVTSHELKGPDGASVLFQWLQTDDPQRLLEDTVDADLQSFIELPTRKPLAKYASLKGQGIVLVGVGTEKKLSMRTFVCRIRSRVLLVHVNHPLTGKDLTPRIEESFKPPADWDA